MALIKDKDSPEGITISYWIISKVSLDKIEERGYILVNGYQSQQRRLDFPSSGVIQRLSYSIPTEEFKIAYKRAIVGGENIYVLAYNYLKGSEKGAPDSIEPNPFYWEDANGNLSFFKDAEDDFEDINT